MPEAFKYVIDAAVGVALFFALILVFVVDRFVLSGTPAVAANTLKGVKVIGGQAKTKDGKRLRLAVTPTAKSRKLGSTVDELWDDMGRLLKHDLKYEYEIVKPQEILDGRKKLKDYDVLFLTCAGGGEDLKDFLRQFVAEGGTLYASDWRYDAVAAAFPEMASEKLKNEGDRQELAAQIVDPALSDALSATTVHLKFDLPEWKTAAFEGPRVKVLMRGKYRINKSTQETTAPLMVKMSFGKGTVIFTSFHNEKQNSRTESELLKYLVFSLVTAGVDAEVQGKMDESGFTPQRSNLLSTPTRNQSTPPKTFENMKKATLRFALGFRNEGAKLRFNIKSPGGEQYTWEGESTVILEVANAEAGAWTYTVTALELPRDNFAFRVTVGEKK
ncbi:MAG: hypothetical protein HYX68_03095 [Planctomycetes bacterium]|nr:hypothetical protein [Planctomycetota bacterium]